MTVAPVPFSPESTGPEPGRVVEFVSWANFVLHDAKPLYDTSESCFEGLVIV